MTTITIELTEEQQKALNEGKSITVTSHSVAKPSIDYTDLEYPYNKTAVISGTIVWENYGGDDPEFKRFGLYRKYLKNAERDFSLKTQLLRLGALVEAVQEELGDKFAPDWKNINQDKYFVKYDHCHKLYFVDVECRNYEDTIGVLHMSEQVADKVVDILNSNPSIIPK